MQFLEAKGSCMYAYEAENGYAYFIYLSKKKEEKNEKTKWFSCSLEFFSS